MEKRDLYDANRNLTGEWIYKNDEIPKERYILVVLCFIENSRGKFLIQKRSIEKDGEYGSTGGHPKSGESSIEGMLTEIKEEIGLDVTQDDVQLFYSDRDDKENVFFDLYYIKKDLSIDELILQEEEVEFVKWCSIDEINELRKNGVFKKSHAEAFDRLMKILDRYEVIIFDLDDTLIDDIESIKHSFKIVLDYTNEEYTEEKFARFNDIDKKFWSDWQLGKIIIPDEYMDNIEDRKMWLRSQRFIIYFDNKINLEFANELNNIYVDALSENIVPVENAKLAIEYLSLKYKIVVATNGPKVAMKSKLEKARLLEHVYETFSAEEVGVMKPKDEFFAGIMNKINYYERNKILVIGDSPYSDIKGANDNGMDSCWFNYKKVELDEEYKPKYIINDLSELIELL